MPEPAGQVAVVLERLADSFGLDQVQAAALEAYVAAIVGWPGNVTGTKDPAEIAGTLLGDALALLDVPQLREREGAGWLDLGAGAGIPGVPLAVAVPSACVTLLEAASRKCAFLEQAVRAAGVSERAAVVCARSERHAAAGAPGRETYDVVLARAVAPLAVLVELAAPLLAPGGVLLASKTARGAVDEGAAAERTAALCGMEPGPTPPLPRSPLDDAVCVVFRRTGPLPDRLPRRDGMAAKRPLGG